MALNFYNAYIDNIAKSPKEEYLSEYDHVVSQDFNSSTTVQTILEETGRGTGEFNEIDARITRLIDPKTGTKQGDDWRKITYSDKVSDKVGFLYQFFDSYWITVNGDLYGMPTSSMVARKCNEKLRWYDDNGVYREIPIPLMASNAGMLLNGNKYMELANGQRDATIQNNDYTKYLKDGQEFIFGRPEKRTKYRIIHQDDTDECDTIGVRFERYQVNEELDNFELGIANYYARPIFKLTILNDDGEFVIGDTIQINYIILDKDNQQVSKDVLYESSDESVMTIDSNGIVTALTDGIATVKVSMVNNTDVFDELTLLVTATPSSNVYIDVSNSTTEITKTFTETYIWSKYDNGVLLTSNFTFEIDTSSTASSNDYDFTVINENSYSITCINEGKKLVVNILEDDGLSKQITYDLVGFW